MESIHNLFHDNKAARAMQLEQQFFTTVKGTSSIASYCQTLRNIADWLDDADAPVTENQLVLQTLRGLPEDLSNQASFLQFQKPPPTFMETRSALLLLEGQRRPHAVTGEQSTALAVHGGGGSRSPGHGGHGGQQFGHSSGGTGPPQGYGGRGQAHGGRGGRPTRGRGRGRHAGAHPRPTSGHCHGREEEVPPPPHEGHNEVHRAAHGGFHSEPQVVHHVSHDGNQLIRPYCDDEIGGDRQTYNSIRYVAGQVSSSTSPSVTSSSFLFALIHPILTKFEKGGRLRVKIIDADKQRWKILEEFIPRKARTNSSPHVLLQGDENNNNML
ncbi:unnamed protein product [Cuscuta campestris]|uniref:Uncharacterized protein n=1 Tax=Cuscuta campestris TaxID=132261 RepID=A0A484MZH2_9ASTE|nr:unnamed protein product [Cuscuta campestris]